MIVLRTRRVEINGRLMSKMRSLKNTEGRENAYLCTTYKYSWYKLSILQNIWLRNRICSLRIWIEITKCDCVLSNIIHIFFASITVCFDQPNIMTIWTFEFYWSFRLGVLIFLPLQRIIKWKRNCFLSFQIILLQGLIKVIRKFLSKL